MENILPIHLQEVVFSSSDSKFSKQISKLEKAGKLRKIAARIYSPNFTDSAETIVRRNLFAILGKLYPGSMISHRSAMEFKPTSAWHIFLTYTYTKKISLPGITIRFMEGHGPIEGDNAFSGELYASQMERALLENMQVSRQPGPESKTITLPELEDRLEQVIRVKGEAGLNELRDKAGIIAEKLAMQKEFKDLPEKNITSRSFRNFAFFEAYFSNYIEGTEFELEDAKKIIETETPILNRDEDSHDVLGTYKLVSNREEMNITPGKPKELLELLLYRHKVLLSARTSKKPGQFKDKNNRAGETHFVDHTLVKGTMIKGFDFYQALTAPFAKAAYIMFLVSEVHPFLDGNGRIARVMMNAELVKQGQSKIIIPTVYRDDYMLALRRLTRQQDPSAYVKMLLRAHEFSSTIIGDDMDAMEKHLEASNAFKEHDKAKLKIVNGKG